MNKANEIKAAILASVASRTARLHDKRGKRRNLSDLCNMFEDGWRSGQKERNPEIIPSRLVSRDRALLKSQIINPARDTGIDVREFGHWIALNWDGIGGTYFQKSKSYPAHPAFAWLVRCLETYTAAYHDRDGLDLSGVGNPSQRVTTARVAAISSKAEKAVATAADLVADLEAQLREANRENSELRRAKALPIDDDPVYARAAKIASRPITIGKYDDDEQPVRRKLKRHRT